MEKTRIDTFPNAHVVGQRRFDSSNKNIGHERVGLGLHTCQGMDLAEFEGRPMCAPGLLLIVPQAASRQA